MEEGLLSGYRVLDLTDEKGFLCGRILGDLGADVIKVERPGGDPSRRRGPFYRDVPNPERSLYWFAYNANKRGVTLNLGGEDGRGLFRRLVQRSDVVVESFAPGYMGSLGLGYEDLSKINPGLLVTSITPFGQEGPRSEYKDGDGVMWAMGGAMYLSGDPDRPPVRVGFPQSYLHAGAAAAVGTLIALYHRDTSGKGQHVDVSIQECVVATTMNAHLFWDVNRVNLKRAGQLRTGLSTAANQRLIWSCKDGSVNFPLFGGTAGARANRALTEWMEEEGMGSEDMKSTDWDAFDMAQTTEEEFGRFEEAISRFFNAHTMEELFQGALQRRIMLYPVYTPREIARSPQLEARGFWEEVEHPELGEKITYPGPFAKLSETSLKIKRRAPLIGEHNEEIYSGELGLSRQELLLLKQAGVI